jgi:hypothetical protein
MNVKILLDFKRLNDAELIAFVLQILSNTDGIVQYVKLQEQVDIVKASFDVYTKSVEAAADGGKTLNLIKKQDRIKLLKDLQTLVLLTELNADGSEVYATGAGFSIRQKPQRSNQPLPMPVFKYVRRGVKSGTIVGELVNFPTGAREFSLLHSTDGGVTSTNGTSSSGKRFVLEVGVVEQRVQVQGYFIGTFQRKSDLCAPVEVFVL